MNKVYRCAHVAGITVLMSLLSTPAYAYLDPGTGSAVVTVILGFFAAVIFTVRKYYYRLTSFFRRSVGGDKAREPGRRE